MEVPPEFYINYAKHPKREYVLFCRDEIEIWKTELDNGGGKDYLSGGSLSDEDRQQVLCLLDQERDRIEDALRTFGQT